MNKEATSILAFQQQEANGDNERVRELVLDAIKIVGIGTRETVAEITGLSQEQTGKRFSELERQGLIYKTNLAKLSKTTNKLQYVWAISGLSAFKMPLND